MTFDLTQNDCASTLTLRFCTSDVNIAITDDASVVGIKSAGEIYAKCAEFQDGGACNNGSGRVTTCF